MNLGLFGGLAPTAWKQFTPQIVCVNQDAAGTGLTQPTLDSVDGHSQFGKYFLSDGICVAQYQLGFFGSSTVGAGGPYAISLPLPVRRPFANTMSRVPIGMAMAYRALVSPYLNIPCAVIPADPWASLQGRHSNYMQIVAPYSTAYGAGSISAATSSGNIAHGLAVPPHPSSITVTPTSYGGTGLMSPFYVNGIDTTNFVVNSQASGTANLSYKIVDPPKSGHGGNLVGPEIPFDWNGYAPYGRLFVEVIYEPASSTGPPTYINQAPALIAQAWTTGGSGTRTVAVGHGTASTGTTFGLKGDVMPGDLLIVCLGGNSGTNGLTLGMVDASNASIGDSGITATSTDGGIQLVPDGSHYMNWFSHVIQPGDIVGGQVYARFSAAVPTASGTRVFACVYRHPYGFPTTGSLHGCPTVGSSSGNNGTKTETISFTPSSTKPYLALAGWGGGSSSTSRTYAWDGGAALLNDLQDTSAVYTWASRPGPTTNVGYIDGTIGSSVVSDGSGGTGHSISMVGWASN